MNNFADRLIEAIGDKGNPCIVGLDPRIGDMPDFVTSAVRSSGRAEDAGRAITDFHEQVLDAVADLVPAVKLQIAFYEQYGLPGMRAFADTIALARSAGLIVVVDAKRNDIDSTAEAYASAFLGAADIGGRRVPAWDVDCITVSPFLGRDSLEPFAAACAEYGKEIFVLVRTSNPGAEDLQSRVAEDGDEISSHLARLVDDLGRDMVGHSGYSSIGAVVGATYPHEAERLRAMMPKAVILVPGYGAQGGTATDAVVNFNADGLGAVVNASRSITYAFGDRTIRPESFVAAVRDNAGRMVADMTRALAQRRVS